GHRTGANGDFRFTLAVLEAFPTEKRTPLSGRDDLPISRLKGRQSVQFSYLRRCSSFAHRRSLHLSSANRRYSLDISIPTDLRPSQNATRFVVPVPANGSNTIPPSGHVARIGIRHKSSGYGAKWSFRFCVSSGRMSQTSLGLAPFGWYLRK